MKYKDFSSSQKDFYQKIKKSLQIKGNWITQSSAATTDLVVLNLDKDIQLYKIVYSQDVDKVPIWKKKIKETYVLAWWRAIYILIYVDEDMNEIKREQIPLKRSATE